MFTGVGNALACTTFVVVLGYYFEKRRNIIIAISQAALGIGFFLASPVALAALNKFGLQGIFIILGSAYAQICVIAVICKPSSIEQRIMGRHKTEYELEIVNVEEIKPLDKHKHVLMENYKNTEMDDMLLDKRISDMENVFESRHINGNRLKTLAATGDNQLNGSTEITYEINGHLTVEYPLIKVCNGIGRHEPPLVTTSCSDIPRSPKSIQRKAVSSCLDIPRRTLPTKNFIDNRVFWSNGHLSNIAASNGFLHELFQIDKSEEFSTQLSGNRLWIWRVLNGICNVHLFKNTSFILFLISTMTWNFTLSICVMHLPNYMVLKGSGDFEVAAIMTCFSFCNFAGRFIGKFYIRTTLLLTLN